MTSAADSAVSQHACARCGGDAEHDFVDLWLCTDCYYIAGSTCAGVNVKPKPDGVADDSPGAVC